MKKNNQPIHCAVLGASGVGKTSFIGCVCYPKVPTDANAYTPVSIGGHTIYFYDGYRPSNSPTLIDIHLFDATDPKGWNTSDLSCGSIVVLNKYDTIEKDTKIALSNAAYNAFVPKYKVFQASTSSFYNIATIVEYLLTIQQ